MMFPTIRCYILLCVGFLVAWFLGLVFGNPVSVLITILYDLVVVALTIWDGIRVDKNKVAITRKPLTRLLVGRDNKVTLEVVSPQSAFIRVKDEYPLQFAVSEDVLLADLPAKSKSELSYHIHPISRGEYQWGDIAIRQLGNWGLAWRNWKVEAKQKVSRTYIFL